MYQENDIVRVGAVSYLNAVPLVAGLEGSTPDLHLSPRVPSALLSDLVAGLTQIALCPVIDFQRAPRPLSVVPSGGIGCAGPTLTVRLFSRVPLDEVQTIRVDGDSHTSVALLQVLYRRMFGRVPHLAPLHTLPGAANGSLEACLLIGDKVVTASPAAELFPHQLDLGEAWHRVTGLPFVFAVWMSPRGADLGELPVILSRQRERNAGRLLELAATHAPRHGWPEDLAARYLGSLLRYRVGEQELEAVSLFWRDCHELGLIADLRPLELYDKGR